MNILKNYGGAKPPFHFHPKSKFTPRRRGERRERNNLTLCLPVSVVQVLNLLPAVQLLAIFISVDNARSKADSAQHLRSRR
jgi:hypothetical protein